MARAKIKAVIDMDVADNKRRLLSFVGRLTGMYEVEIQPRRNTRTLRQNAFYWGCLITPLYEYLREHDVDVTSTEHVHEMVKEHLLRVPVTNRLTGEVVGWRTRSTTELSVAEFADFAERFIAWTFQKTGMIAPDPAEYLAEPKRKQLA